MVTPSWITSPCSWPTRLTAATTTPLGMPADGSGVEDGLRAAERSQAGGLGIPLVPADERADRSIGCRNRFESEVTGREVKLLVVERIVGDVHLAVNAGN